MEHSEGDGFQRQEGRPPLQQQNQQQSPQNQGGAPFSWSLQQQQQQEYYLLQQQQQVGPYGTVPSRSAVAAGSGRPLSSSDSIMAAAPSLQQYPYLAAQHQQQQQQQQRYLQQQQYAATFGAAASGYHHTVGGGALPPQHMQQQYVAHQQQQQQQQLTYQQQLAAMQMAAAAQQLGAPGGASLPPHHLHHHHHPGMDPNAILTAAVAAANFPTAQPPFPPILQQPHPTVQPRVGRVPTDRPIIKLSLSLIDTYKHINDVYYQEREARKAKAKQDKDAAGTAAAAAGAKKTGGSDKTSKPAAAAAATTHPKQGAGANNNGWDDDNYDYIINPGELFYNGRYRIKERIGKGSFGQVVRADDLQDNVEVAIKIIKSKKPFLMQAKTEIELLTHLNDKDTDDQYNIVRLLRHFMYRNHQCLVFEMLSLNLYELLKNTQFGGVSLNLIRKFAKQVLKALAFLARKDVDIIHCDLKPENILLRHPKKSGVKVIDFGSSCRSNKRMYTYIQSRFYRSPEVMLGLPYAVSIDMWSLGCILAEMHTGEPLFSGSDQFDQMQKIVKLLGMVPDHMLEQSSDQHRLQFFERAVLGPSGRVGWTIKQQQNTSGSTSRTSSGSQTQQQSQQKTVSPSQNPQASLMEVIRAETHRKKKYPPSETGNSPRNYELFVDLIHKMLAYDPRERITPLTALEHPFVTGPAT